MFLNKIWCIQQQNYKNTFQIRDSVLKVVYDNYDSFENNYAQIYYKKPYSYYKLKFEYRFTGNQTKGGAGWAKRNSGIAIKANVSTAEK